MEADLARLWEEHTHHEFSTRDTESTLATMAEDAYVNHVPVLTGGAGKSALRTFYSVDFILRMPLGTKLTPISRTVGEAQLVDEMIFSFTRTQEMPRMLPGIPPSITTGRAILPARSAVRCAFLGPDPPLFPSGPLSTRLPGCVQLARVSSAANQRITGLSIRYYRSASPKLTAYSFSFSSM